MTSQSLKRVERAAVSLDRARAELEGAMRAASAAGVSLRPIAQASGFSVERVRQLLAKSSR